MCNMLRHFKGNIPWHGWQSCTCHVKLQMAEAILQKAKDNGIPIQEDSSLVEVLSKLDLDQEIPPELYQLVAEVLSFIYRSDNRMRLQRDRE